MECLVVGGYGGHAGMAYAIATAAAQLGVQCRLVVPWSYIVDYPYIIIVDMPGRPERRTGLLTVLRAYLMARNIVAREKPRVVVATGGPLSVAMLAATRAHRIFVEAPCRLTSRSRSGSYALRLADTIIVHYKQQLEIYRDAEVVGPIYDVHTIDPFYYTKYGAYDVVITLGSSSTIPSWMLELPTYIADLVHPSRVLIQTVNKDMISAAYEHGIRVFKVLSPRVLHSLIHGSRLVITKTPSITMLSTKLGYGIPTAAALVTHKYGVSPHDAIACGRMTADLVILNEFDLEDVAKLLKRAPLVPQFNPSPGAKRVARIIAEVLGR